jgi:putative endonuclease
MAMAAWPDLFAPSVGPRSGPESKGGHRLDRTDHGNEKRARGSSRAPRWWVYLLRCGDGSLYAGATNDLARRLLAHSRGTASRYTRSRLPVTLALAVPARDRSAALRREAALKRLTRGEKLALVARAGVRGAAPPTRPAPARTLAPRASPSRRRERGA